MEANVNVEHNFELFSSLAEYNLVYLKLEIFLYLDHESLHTARQVCKDWDSFIVREIWQARPEHTRRMLARRWRAPPSLKRVLDCPASQGFYLAVTNRTVGVGTKSRDTLLLSARSGAQLGVLDSRLGAEADTEGGDGDGAGPVATFAGMDGVYDDEADDVQLDMTDEVIVTVTGSGAVSVWDRGSLALLYTHRPHGRDNVLGVRVVADFIVTGGSRGSIATYSLIKDTTGSISVRLDHFKARAHRAVSHMDSDGVRVLVGTERTMALWDCSTRDQPVLSSSVPCGQVCCCVMSHPFAFCTGLFINYGVQVWDMVKQVKIRHIHADLSMWVITIKDNMLATSMSVIREDDENFDECPNTSPSIFLHDIRDLVDPEVKSEKIWTQEIECPIEHFSDPHIALNSTSLFAVARNSSKGQSSKGSKIHVWDFWTYVGVWDLDMNE